MWNMQVDFKECNLCKKVCEVSVNFNKTRYEEVIEPMKLRNRIQLSSAQ